MWLTLLVYLAVCLRWTLKSCHGYLRDAIDQYPQVVGCLLSTQIFATNSSVDSPAFSGIPETRNCYTDVHGIAVPPELQYDLIDLYW